MKLYRLNDLPTIHQKFLKDDLYKNILGLEDINKWHLNTNKEYAFIGIENSKEVGVVLIQDVGQGYVNFHAGLYKDSRGKNTLKYLKHTIKQLKRLVYPLKLITTVREDNKSVCRLDEAAGLKYKFTKNINNIPHKVYME